MLFLISGGCDLHLALKTVFFLVSDVDFFYFASLRLQENRTYCSDFQNIDSKNALEERPFSEGLALARVKTGFSAVCLIQNLPKNTV